MKIKQGHLYCLMSCASVRVCVHGHVVLCLSSNSHHPPLPCTHIPNAISSLTLTRLAGLPSAILSAALMPVGCRNDSFCKKKKSPAVCSQSMRMKSGKEEEDEEEEEEEDESVTSPLLYSCSLIQFHGADLTKARTRAP